MKKELKKISLIVNEILTLLLYHGAKDISIQINKENNQIDLIFIQNDYNFDIEFVETLRNDLKNQRQNEVEGYYWQLVGQDDSSNELQLVGAMIDESKVTLEGSTLTINIKRICDD